MMYTSVETKAIEELIEMNKSVEALKNQIWDSMMQASSFLGDTNIAKAVGSLDVLLLNIDIKLSMMLEEEDF